MRGEFVALDLETTGLDAEHDAIIEFGGVRMRDGQITDEYSTLVNPGRPIPDYVRTLTGISDDDFLAKTHNPGEPAQHAAPTIAEALPEIRAFVGNATIIGHNVGFDLSFLRREGILQSNLWVDTYDLASVLLPRAPRYNLGSLAGQMNIPLDEAHRALHDARASALLYWALWQKVLTLPASILSEIYNASQGLDWNAHIFFEAALEEQRNRGTALSSAEFDPISQFKPYADSGTPLQSGQTGQPIGVQEAVTLLTERVAQQMANYEPRPQQVEMTERMVEAFNDRKHVMIEAGTGIGKSIAYLIPSILWATHNHERVVISTNTINLQEQLLDKDIPALRSALDIPFNAVILKGRGNYLCPRRLIALRRRHPTHVDELRTLAKVLVWLTEGGSGDKSEISLRGPIENTTWQRLSAEDENCGIDRCDAAMQGVCPFHKARKGAESAHLVIVNHALLVSDATSDNQVLPEYRYLVVDEAHHLEEAITNGLSFRIDEATVRRRLADLGSSNHGLLGEVLRNLQGHIPDTEMSRLTVFVKNVNGAIRAMESHITSLFEGFRELHAATNGYAGDYQLRITTELRQKAPFAVIPTRWTVLKEFFDAVGDAVKQLTGLLSRAEQYHIPDYDDLLNSTRATASYLRDLEQELGAFAQSPDANRIYWLTLNQNNVLTLHSAPLHVGNLVEQYLWQAKDTVVLTSATLQTDQGFAYMSERLHAETFETTAVGSPFDYRASTLLLIPEDMPDPSDRQRYQQSVERGLVELAAKLDGRVMALFTSYTQLRQTAQAISPRLALGNIMVYDQSEGGSRQALLDGFKSNEKAVLLGTKSFWEGVDIPGDSLSAVVITRLPFAVPNEPVFAARSETYKDSFADYAVPEAVLRFRQGFGRLIRSKTDRGVVAIFDRRIISKGYGVNFLEALPDCEIQQGKLEALPDIARNWIKR